MHQRGRRKYSDDSRDQTGGQRKPSWANERGRGNSPDSQLNDGNPKQFPKNPKSKTNTGTNVYIANISSRVHSRDFEKYFSKFGRIVNALLKKDPVTG
jgi:RNA recognition motif-containing protein